MLPTQNQIESNELKNLIDSLPGDQDVKENIYQKFFTEKNSNELFYFSSQLSNLVFPKSGISSQALSDEQSLNFHFLRGLIYTLYEFRHDENFTKDFAEHWKQNPEQHKNASFVDEFIQKKYNFKIFDYSALILSPHRYNDPNLRIDSFKTELYQLLENEKYSDAFGFVKSKFDDAKKNYISFYREPYHSEQFFNHQAEQLEIAKKFFDTFIEQTRKNKIKGSADKIHITFEERLKTQDFGNIGDEVFDAIKSIPQPEAKASIPTMQVRREVTEPIEAKTDSNDVLKSLFPKKAEITEASSKISSQFSKNPFFHAFVDEIFKTDYIIINDINTEEIEIGQEWLEKFYQDLSEGIDSVNGGFIKKINKIFRNSNHLETKLRKFSDSENKSEKIKNYYECYKKVCTFFRESLQELIKTSSVNGSLNQDLLKIRFLSWIDLINRIRVKNFDQTSINNQLTFRDEDPKAIKELLEKYKDNDWFKKLSLKLDKSAKLESLIDEYKKYSPQQADEDHAKQQEEQELLRAAELERLRGTAPATSPMPREKYKEFVDLNETVVEHSLPYQRAQFYYNSKRSIPKKTPTSDECKSFKDEEMYKRIYNFITTKIKNKNFVVQPNELVADSSNSEFSCDQVGIIQKKNILIDSYYFAIRLKNSSNSDLDCTIYIGDSLKCKFDKVNSENADSFYSDPSHKKSASDFVSENSKGNVSYIKPEILKQILTALNGIKRIQTKSRY